MGLSPPSRCSIFDLSAQEPLNMRSRADGCVRVVHEALMPTLLTVPGGLSGPPQEPAVELGNRVAARTGIAEPVAARCRLEAKRPAEPWGSAGRGGALR